MPLWASGYRNLLPNRRRMMEGGAGGAGGYSSKVLGYSPIAYWPLWETSGLVANCLVNPAQNGVYTGVTLANGAGPDGSPCPFFDGINDYVNCLTAAIIANFVPNESTAFGWARVANAGVWTDAVTRYIFSVRSTGSTDVIAVFKDNVNNAFRMDMTVNTIISSTGNIVFSSADWFSWAITHSQAASRIRFFINGIQQGGDFANAGVWNNQNYNRFYYGVASIATVPWHGWNAHEILWNRELTPAEVLDVHTV